MNESHKKMTRIQIKPDCGNSPRKLFLKNLYIAFANGNIDYITDNIPEQITWLIIGEKIINGKKNFLTELEKHKLWKTKDLIIDTIITHGTDASVAGLATLENNTGFSFCDIYKFKGAGGTGINSITTFIIDIKN